MPDQERDGLGLVDHETAFDRIRAALASREPFSLVRIGDGEGVVLAADESAWLHDLADLHRHWGSQQITLRDVLDVRRDLEEAIAHADLIGVRPDLLAADVPSDLLDRPLSEVGAYVREHFDLREAEKNLGDAAARRFAQANRAMVSLPTSSNGEFCSSWIHWEMLAHGVVDEVLSDEREVVLVTCHPELGPIVAERFGTRVHVVAVPGKFVDSGVPGAHIPLRYAEMRAELSGVAPGTLALVGAGIPGKAYCHWLKEAGCVALDVGAIFDAWVGKPSRPIVFRDRFGVADGSVPEHLRLVDRPAERAEADEGRRRPQPPARRLQAARQQLTRARELQRKAEQERDAARRELALLENRRSVRAALAAARLLRGQRR